MIEELTKMIEHASNPSLRSSKSMVYELWEDGEVTLTKCGDLLRRRTLHMIGAPILTNKVYTDMIKLVMDDQGQHSCIALTNADAEAIRAEMIKIEIEGN
jgi:hypothetical protein